MNNDRKAKKKRLIITLILYAAAGMATIFIFYKNGSYIRNREDIVYNFEDAQPPADLTIQETIVIEDEQTDGQDSGQASDEQEDADASDDQQNAEETVKHYYTYTTVNYTNGLRIRETPSVQAKILGSMEPGTTGYVLEDGDYWCLIRYEDVTGYCFRSWLQLTEIPEEELPEDFPQEYR